MMTRNGSKVATLFALLFAGAMGALAQHERHGQTKPPEPGSMDMGKMMRAPAEGKTMTQANMMEHCQEMKEQKQKMKEDMQAQDAQLTEQLAGMNRAPENKKMGLMAAVLTHTVEQRIAMDARKAKLEEEMMQHMMQHMQMGKDSMSRCPMMKDTDGKSASTR